MFYSVDVETGNTFPMPGALLTVGIVAVDKVSYGNGKEVGWQKVDNLYVHLAYDEKMFSEDTIKDFWENEDLVSEEARREAFDWNLSRVHPASAAVMIANFVLDKSVQSESFFAANPASFDFGWIDMLFASSGIKIPFSHRTLCLRSMAFGMNGGNFGEKRGAEHAPKIPHHALYDADAQADQLIDMLNLL